MTTPTGATPAGAELDRADLIAAAAVSVDGVEAMHGGMFGEAATYLPGRQVAGVRLTEDGTEVHVVVDYGRAVHRVADAVRRAVSPLVTGSVDVVIEDVSTADASTTADVRTPGVGTADVITTGSTA